MMRVPSDKSIYAAIKLVGRPKAADGRLHESDCLEFVAGALRWLPRAGRAALSQDCDAYQFIIGDNPARHYELVQLLRRSGIQPQVLAVAAWDLAKKYEEIHSIKYRPYRKGKEPDIDFKEELAAIKRQEPKNSEWTQYLKRKRQERKIANNPNWSPPKRSSAPPKLTPRFKRHLRRFRGSKSQLTKEDVELLKATLGYDEAQLHGFSTGVARARRKSFKLRKRFPPPPRALLQMSKRMLTHWRQKDDFGKAQKLIATLAKQEIKAYAAKEYD
jgi:hypothetical protein